MSAADELPLPVQDSGKVIYLLERLQNLSDRVDAGPGPVDHIERMRETADAAETSDATIAPPQSQSPNPMALPPGASPPTITPMSDPTPLIDAKVEAAEARGERNLARLEGKMDATLAGISGKIETFGATMTAKIDAVSAELVHARSTVSAEVSGLRREIEATHSDVKDSRKEARQIGLALALAIVASVLAVGALFFSALSTSSDSIGRGMEIRKVVDEAVQETIKAMSKPPTSIESDANKLK